MKKRFFYCLLTLASVWVISCSPDEPDEPDPNMKWRTEPAINIIEGIAVGMVTCPTAGSNCKEQSGLLCPSTDQQRQMQDSFYHAYFNNPYEKDLLPFLNRHEFGEIFPDVNLSAPIVTRVQNGTYGLFVSDDTTSLVVTTTPTGSQFYEDDVVATYRRLPGDCR